jgi:hypothetical protein
MSLHQNRHQQQQQHTLHLSTLQPSQVLPAEIFAGTLQAAGTQS